ncbi:hypothetical protein AVT64_gp54 [Acinetobacter phage YMC11/12/R2315]|uniref:Uncharacterized protein n=4 Tax=Obolenskvirus TaxID=1915205 RepID=A0A0D4DC88_9CAUD|nr:hypothetical protein LD30_gp17 [Acinetobacter phage YMC-13-01-C62]YP_009203573.1 hypothetical protein AVT64_gp54 [Acinetobacter phage YMC11/12/R2315]YP_009592196.1 hypothetical protein FDG67_gp45 [Acinetobacter phage vB_AbaM-IME-AB2]AJT61446.1 hypothetical protein ABA1215_00500 [Acinetobacter phage YMC11/12/R1215]QGH74082.1 hypothetical protein BphiR2919_00047 [Acinetobacter phage Bphi-R2919]WNT46082.1 hypothetical protein [Acinetobacter phage P115]WNT46331.1 hypothetical protein [Acinetob
MENYKIRVNNEAESKEAQELFIQLGYELDLLFGKYEANTKWVLAFADGSMGCACEALDKDTLKEITFPQLRDLVVLKRNDVKDANYISKSVLDGFYFKSCDGVFYFMFEGKWVRSTTNTDEGLEPITKGLDLISGAEALRALADGKEAEGFSEENEEWVPIVYFTVQEVVNGLYKFRIKPQTVKLELELPKPFEPKVGEEYFYISHTNSGYDSDIYEGTNTDECRTQMGCWRTKAEAKQVVEQLRKIKGAV